MLPKPVITTGHLSFSGIKGDCLEQGKKGALAAYEAAGKMVLSYESKREGEVNERKTFAGGSLETVQQLLKDISPEEQSSSLFARFLPS